MSAPAPLSAPTRPTLYHIQFWSSSRPLAVLLKLGAAGRPGAPVDVVTITAAQLKTDPAIVSVNPQRRLPLFVDPGRGLALCESGAIAEHILETYDTEHSLYPRAGEKTRADFLQLLHFGPASAYHVCVPILFHGSPPMEELRTADDKLQSCKKQWHEIVAPTVEAALEKFGGPYLLGPELSAADLVLSYDVMTVSFAGVPELLADHPKVKAYLDVMSKNEVYAKIYTPTE